MLEKVSEVFNSIQNSVWPYLEKAWGVFGDYAYLKVAFVATLGYLVARLFAKYIPNFLSRILSNTRIPLSKDIADLLRFPLFNLIFLSGLLLALKASGMNSAVMVAMTSILTSLMIVVVGVFAYKLIKILFIHSAKNNNDKGVIQVKTLPLFNNAAFVFVLIGATHQIFAVWNVDMTALLASAGIAGMAVGMAAQGTIADIIAGILILTDEPFAVGDVIQLDSGDAQIKGVVTRIGIRSTRILNELNVEVVIPNGLLGNSRVLNESSSIEKGGVVVVNITIASGVDADRMRTLLMDVANQFPDADHTKEKEVHMLDFDWRCVRFELVVWSAESDWEGHVAAGLREAVYKRLCHEKIPFSLPEIGEMAITEMANSRQEVAITQMADSRQEVRITETPESTSHVYIKEAPNLFGLGPIKQHSDKPLSQRATERKPEGSVK
ncbi:mechanosensitive ion channel family protein [Leucothrix arctica]|uniref:Small-conductance mechanosensitive channel n=1 Tax=Leucothrix arctica TaxID=1481894 RepID=A0A317CM03_9GAMM|nr:mechanosensitive ion channel family protein [Leucothrix arctica]PWQ99251.1 hypothetical protein DKT75_01515 [Leucothrix arctica]